MSSAERLTHRALALLTRRAARPDGSRRRGDAVRRSGASAGAVSNGFGSAARLGARRLGGRAGGRTGVRSPSGSTRGSTRSKRRLAARRRRGENFARGLGALRGRVAERLGFGDHVAEALQPLVGDRCGSACARATRAAARRRGRRGLSAARSPALGIGLRGGRLGRGASRPRRAASASTLRIASSSASRSRVISASSAAELHPAQLRHQSRARPLIEQRAVLRRCSSPDRRRRWR